MDISKWKIIGSIDERHPNGDVHVNHIWFDPETNKPYDHIDGQWVEINPVTPDVQIMIDQEVNKMPVLVVTSHGYPGHTLYLNTLKGIEEQLEMFFGEDDTWSDYENVQVTIRTTRMNKVEFAALKPLEL